MLLLAPSIASIVDDTTPELSTEQIAKIDEQLASKRAADALVERGPFVADPEVLAELDRAQPGEDCDSAGRLAFGCLIQGRVAQTRETPSGKLANPFNLGVASIIRMKIKTDLDEFSSEIDRDFLTHPESRLQLVGIVNRMDRKFVPDPRGGVGSREDCGEISLVYRFLYAVPGGSSRLPVTMNVVLPALPNNFPITKHPCQEMARRWMLEVNAPPGRTPKERVAALLDPKDGVLASITGADIDRIELNIQAFRRQTKVDASDLGSTAAYVIRVFRWDGRLTKFVTSYLANQVDRARLLGRAGDSNSCLSEANPGLQREFLQYLQQPAVIDSIDAGTLNIPIQFLACRAVSHSPGGPVRSGNAPFWQDEKGGSTILTDADLAKLLGSPAGQRASMFRTTGDLRMRLNEMSCTGCHQTRAIAGFHFPGEDRGETPSANAVSLAGSPHFFGDQPRRVDFLRLLEEGRDPVEKDYRSSYASRPLNKYRADLSSTQLIGGWGAVCLTPDYLTARLTRGTKREWTCKPGLHCAQQYISSNAPGLGTCVPDGHRQVGDAMQVGRVATSSFGKDQYIRTLPAPVGPRTDTRDTRLFPGVDVPPAPPGNSYFVAHQEWFKGDIDAVGKTGADRASTIRDAQTGGFPGGMLRLSECRGLGPEATCGLTATNGFSDCIAAVSADRPLINCFLRRTSYAGMRACSASSPCRDDYICLRSIGYNAANASDKFEGRAKLVRGQTGYSAAAGDFGQSKPGPAWLARNRGNGDQRGVCIPPYFVFQFRSDGHPMVSAQ